MQDFPPQKTSRKFQIKKWLFPFIEAALVVGFFIFVANISANPYSMPSTESGLAAGPQLQYACYTPAACPPGEGPTATPTQPPITLQLITPPGPNPTPSPVPPQPTTPRTSEPGPTAPTTVKVVPAANAECAAIASGGALRITNRVSNLGNNSYNLCIYVVAGADGVNLNDTIIINLPAGASVGDQAASIGSLSVNQNVVRWGGYSLASRQTSTLRLTVNNGTGNLAANSSILVSGRFNQGQAFQQRFNGLPPLIEIGGASTNNNVAPGSPQPTGGQGGAVVPEAAPASGKGNLAQAESGNTGLLIVASLIGLMALTGLGLRRFWLRRR